MSFENSEELKRKTVGSALWKFAERICAKVVSLAVSILLARILLPEDYSVVSIVAIFFAFCDVIISGGLNTALIQKKDADRQDYATVLWASMAMAALLYGVFFFCAPLVARLYEKSQLTLVIRVMGLTFFINGFKSVLSAYTSSNLQFKKFFFSTIVGTAVSAVVGITMALKGFGAWALVAQQMTNSLIDTLILYLTTRLDLRARFSFRRLRSLLSYGWKVLVMGMITVAYDQANPLIVGLRFTGTDLAYYSKGKSFPDLVDTTVSDTLAAVLFPAMAKVQDDKEAVLRFTRRYMKTATYVIFPVLVGMFAVADTFVRTLLTEKWLDAVPYIRIFAVALLFNPINVGNLQAIKAIGRSDITLILEIIKKSTYFVVVALFLFFSRSPQMLAVSAVICALIAITVNTFPNRKLIGYRYREQLADILPNLVTSALMGAAIMAMGLISIPGWLLLILQVAAGVCVYVALSILTKNESFFYLLGFLKKIIRRES